MLPPSQRIHIILLHHWLCTVLRREKQTIFFSILYMEVSIFVNENYNQCCQKVSKDLSAQYVLGRFIIILYIIS